MYSSLTLRQRLLSLLVYIGALVIVSGIVTETWFPSEGGKSVWFFAAIALFFFTRLSSPFFVTPRDSLANSATAALLLATVDLDPVVSFQTELNSFRWIAVGYAAFVTTSSIVSISLFQIDEVLHRNLARISKIAYRLSEYLGRGQLVFTPLVLVSIIGFYQDEPIQQLWLLLLWTILVFLEPVDLALKLSQDINLFGAGKAKAQPVGTIQRIDDPNIIRVRLESSQTWGRNTVHIAQLPDSRQVEVIPLFVQTQNAELIGTGMCHKKPPEKLRSASSGYVYCSTSVRTGDQLLAELCGETTPAPLVGFVVENSSISRIRFEAASEEKLQEGWIVFAKRGEDRIFYQILDAHTEEESFSQNPRGSHVVFAQQLGILDSRKGFLKYGWLPNMNSPVFLATTLPTDIGDFECEPDEFYLGSVPHSKIPVVASLKESMEYHTAILGATGMGKTELAFDIIRKAFESGAKVICVDFTGEYFPRLKDLNPKELGLAEKEAKALQTRLFDVEVGDYGGAKEKRVLEDFVKEITKPIETQVHEFLEADGAGLGIFTLGEIANTKATLRATELYVSTIFKWARNNRKKRNILLVLEEAHTIVPETNLFSYA